MLQETGRAVYQIALRLAQWAKQSAWEGSDPLTRADQGWGFSERMGRDGKGDAWECLGIPQNPQEPIGAIVGGEESQCPSSSRGLGPHPAFPLAQVSTAK